jgi:hypothetical protein
MIAKSFENLLDIEKFRKTTLDIAVIADQVN